MILDYVPGKLRSSRRGVTLLEVIVSMGVLVVGLMGMASLIPLGRLEMAEGDRLDNSSTLGRAAFRELSVHGYLNPQMWAHPLNGAKIINRDLNGERYEFNGAVVPPYAPLVIDPLMCAPRFQFEEVNAGGPNDPETGHRTNCQYFPYTAGRPEAKSGWPEQSIPKLARATLRSYPINGSRTLANGLAHTMRFDVASRFFRSSDDLVIDLPLDRVRRPVQVFAQSDMTNLTVTAHDGVTAEVGMEQVAYRKFRGDYSWFFLVEPNPGERWSADDREMPVNAGTTGSAYATNMFRVWVVVCNKRDYRDASTLDLEKDRAVGERCVWIDFIDRYTARLRVLDVADEGTALKILDVKPNQWIAAFSNVENPLLTGGPQCVVEWFRVVNAADRPAQIPDTDTWYREINLAGRDMSSEGTSSLGLTLLPAQDLVPSPYGTEVQPTHIAWGVLIPGVRGVYEKSIYWDGPSLWSPQ